MSIKVTDEAKKEVVELSKRSSFKNPAIRLSVNGFG